ncbi:hypothetical protein T310_6666, partial [Rasamsonia emersonii CBS 393.64]
RRASKGQPRGAACLAPAELQPLSGRRAWWPRPARPARTVSSPSLVCIAWLDASPHALLGVAQSTRSSLERSKDALSLVTMLQCLLPLPRAGALSCSMFASCS